MYSIVSICARRGLTHWYVSCTAVDQEELTRRSKARGPQALPLLQFRVPAGAIPDDSPLEVVEALVRAFFKAP